MLVSGERHVDAGADLVMDVHAINERARGGVRSGFDSVEDRAVVEEVRISATEGAAETGKLLFHLPLDARVFQHIDVRVKTRRDIRRGEPLKIVTILCVTDFMTNQQVILVDRDVFPFRQGQHTGLNIEACRLHDVMPDRDVFTRQQFRETALRFINVRHPVRAGGRRGGGSSSRHHVY